jgi:hypothetical protein
MTTLYACVIRAQLRNGELPEVRDEKAGLAAGLLVPKSGMAT